MRAVMPRFFKLGLPFIAARSVHLHEENADQNFILPYSNPWHAAQPITAHFFLVFQRPTW
jgi:hypothetical protein